MSDLLDTAAAAMGLPVALVQRSAEARAAETGASVDDILSAWTGGAPIAVTEPTIETPQVEEPAQSAPEPEQPPAAVSVMDAPLEIPAPPTIELAAEAEDEESLQAVGLGVRVRTAVRVGAWTGAALGLVAFFIASAFWADSAAVLPDRGPIVQVDERAVVIGVALVSVLFGGVVAGLSRAAAAWTNPAMQLSGSRTSTAWIGAALGLILGVVAGFALVGLGTPIENSDGLTQLPVLATLAIILVGGAILGAITSLMPQLLGTPVAVDEADVEEVEAVRGRLGNAISIPMVALILLFLLVLPFGYTLIRSNHLADGGASIVGILTAGGILGFAALAGGKPEMRISFGDLIWALLGIGSVLVIVLAVLFYSGSAGHEESGGEGNAPIIRLL